MMFAAIPVDKTPIVFPTDYQIRILKDTDSTNKDGRVHFAITAPADQQLTSKKLLVEAVDLSMAEIVIVH